MCCVLCDCWWNVGDGGGDGPCFSACGHVVLAMWLLGLAPIAVAAVWTTVNTHLMMELVVM